MSKPIFFFFDTADIEYIKKAWDKLSANLPASGVAGITTNPSAFSKVNISTIQEAEKNITELCSLVSQIRGDAEGIVYAQIPNASLPIEQIRSFAKFLAGLGDGKTRVGMKIPPFPQVLKHAEELSRYISLNVTGIADCGQALRSLSYPVDYVSIIPGRMEEVGIDAKAHVSFVQERLQGAGKVIAGSMRTIEQLRWTCRMNTVPTIGTKVWDLILALDPKTLPELFKRDMSEVIGQEYAPLTGEAEIKLSRSFFTQMNELGAPMCKSFLGGKSSQELRV